TFEKSFRGVSKDVARAAAVPRNPRRFQRESSPMVISFGLLVSYSGDAIDLDQRVSWQSGNSNGGTRRTSVREIRGEDFVHPVPVLNVGQKYIGLQNGVHSAAADLDHFFQLVHHIRRMCLNCPLTLRGGVMSADSGQVHNAV